MPIRSLCTLKPGAPASEKAPLARRSALPRFGDRWRSTRDDAYWGAGFAASGPDCLLVSDERLRLVYHNRRFSRALGDAQGSFRGLSLCDFFPSTDRAELRTWLRDFLDGRLESLGFSVSLLTLGEPVPVEARAARQTRSGKRRYLYLSLRETAAPAAQSVAGEANTTSVTAGQSGIFDDLPAALFRTEDYIQAIKLPRAVVLSPAREGSTPIPAPVVERKAPAATAPPKTRPTSPLPPPAVLAIAADDDEIASLRRRIRPRPLTSADFCDSPNRARGGTRMVETGRTRTVSLPS